jgi:hypothetical protein
MGTNQARNKSRWSLQMGVCKHKGSTCAGWDHGWICVAYSAVHMHATLLFNIIITLRVPELRVASLFKL